MREYTEKQQVGHDCLRSYDEPEDERMKLLRRYVGYIRHYVAIWGVPWIEEHLTVESSANPRDWSIRYHTRSRTFTVNERSLNNKSLKEKVEKTTKNIKVIQLVGMDQLEQRSVVHFLWLKGLLKKAIHHELVAAPQENAVLYTSVTIFCTEMILGLNSAEASSSPKDDGLDDVNEAILLVLSDQSFSSGPSAQQIARIICVPKGSECHRLVDSLHFTLRHLHWAAHKLSESQKASRIESSCRSNFETSSVHPASRMGI
jgi:hypothetical protein